jgi:MerR family transcriptional regulator, light-induced transcriptional regulator
VSDDQPDHPGDDAVVSLQGAADLLGVHYMTAYRYVRHGLLPATKEGAAWRVREADVEALRDGGEGRGRAGTRALRGRGREQPAPWTDRLEHRLCAGDEKGAWGVVEAALAAGREPAEVYLEVLAPAMTAVGEAWERGDIDVAVEHRASGIAMRLVGRLGPRFARPGRSRGAVVIGAPAGEQHTLPIALVADLVRGGGFEVVEVGADLPAASLARMAAATDRLVAVMVSATTPDRDVAVAEAVAAARGAVPGVAVLVGGAGVADEAAATRLGADGWARDGRGALALLDELAPGRR